MIAFNEKRSRQRIQIDLGACCRFQNGSSLLCGLRTVDLSPVGSLLNSPIAMHSGEKVLLEVHSSTLYCPPVRAEVLRSVPILGGSRYAIALAFDKESPEVLEFLRREEALATI